MAKTDRYWLNTLVFLGISLALLAIDMRDGLSMSHDIDDRLRHLQIRDLYLDGQWHDMRLPGIDMPGSYMSPWSRLVDAPYVALTHILSLMLAPEAALLWAERIVPVMLLVIFALIFVRVLTLLTPTDLSPPVVAVTAMASLIGVIEFAPERIDHHNFQLLCMAGLLWGILESPSHRGGILIGLSTVLSLAIGLETIPYLFIALPGVALIASGNPEWRALTLRSSGIVFLCASAPLGFLLTGTAAAVQCDAYSAPWIWGLTGLGLLFTGLSYLPVQRNRTVDLALFAGSALALIAVMASVYPECLGGPFPMLDDMVKSKWLHDIPQENSLFWMFGYNGYGGQLDLFAKILIVGAIYVIVIGPKISLAETGQKFVFVMLVGMILLAVAQTRSVRIVGAFIGLFLPWAIYELSHHKPEAFKRFRSRTAFACYAGLAVIYGLYLTTPKLAKFAQARKVLALDLCERQDLSALNSVAPGRLIAPLGLSAALVQMRQPHVLTAIPFHRSGFGIRKTLDVFVQPDPQLRKAALEGVDYLALCRGPLHVDMTETPLYHALSKGESWPGLIDVAPDNDSLFRLYKIEHGALM